MLEQAVSHKAVLQALVAWPLAQAETPWERVPRAPFLLRMVGGEAANPGGLLVADSVGDRPQATA